MEPNEITWGDPIEVNGVRLKWLRQSDIIAIKTAAGWVSVHYGDADRDGSSIDDWAWSHRDGTPCITAIRLPADHFAYIALAEGFEPWGGGDSAPDDWDNTSVLFRDGVQFQKVNGIWSWRHRGSSDDIIGYKKRVPAVDAPKPAAPIDWTQPIEAYNVYTGEVVQVKLRDVDPGPDGEGDYYLEHGVGARGLNVFCPSGECWSNPDYPWRIRNRTSVKPALPTYDPETQVVVGKMTRREAVEQYHALWQSKTPLQVHLDVLVNLGIIRQETPPNPSPPSATFLSRKLRRC